MRRLAVLAGLPLIGAVTVLAVVAGTARPQTPIATQPPLSAPAPQPQQPVQSAPSVIATPIAASSRCDAANLAWLVGKPRTAIPVPVDLSERRVSCTTCPVTQDYQPGRTDILFDAQSGLITAVKCG
jgi:hypothetical protein